MYGRVARRASYDARLLSRTHCDNAVRRYSAVAGSEASLPLGGYRVLDMTRVLAGPYCTQILGDLGAEVIKVEHPTRGDDTRAWGPPYASYRKGSGLEGPGESAYFLGVNRNKKSLGLSFQHPEGVEILHKLAAKCDILVENYLPGSLKKYGMDFETIHKINPSLIYASITGYGQTGPYAGRAGYDVMVEAEFGLMHITGSRDGPPVKVGVAVTDLTTGLYTSNSIMAALLARAKSGRGQHIDVALSDCQTATLANIASSCLISGEKDTGRWGTAHPSIVPYRSFKTSDGDILLGGGNDRLFGILCDGLGRPEWKSDARYASNAARVAHRATLEAEIEALTAARTTRAWLDAFEGKGLPYAAVNDVRATLDHAHTRARGMVVELEHDACGPVRLVDTPVKYSESRPGARTAPPTLGQHTDEVLAEILGMDRGAVDELKSRGAGRVKACVAYPAPVPGANTSAPARPSPAPSASSSSSRAPYIPTFTPATQMIINSLNNNKNGLSTALSSVSGVASSIERSAFEDAKKRLMMNMNTSMSMSLPALKPKPPTARPSKARIPLSSAFQLRTPAPIVASVPGPALSPAPTPAKSTTSSKPGGAPYAAPSHKPQHPRAKAKQGRGSRRKRARAASDSSPSLSDLSDSGAEPAASRVKTEPTTTKSGRHVQKPAQYKPSPSTASAAPQRRKQWGKRTAEQALCKVCGRGRSLSDNQILCHGPPIADVYVRDESRSWFCSGCARAGKRAAGIASGELTGHSWGGRSEAEKRDWLLAQSKGQLVDLLVLCTDMYPSLPIFPRPEVLPPAGAPVTPVDKPHKRRKSAALIAAEAAYRADNSVSSSEDSIPAAWPAPGRGCLRNVKFSEEDFRDDDDYEAFSVATYDKKGKKIWENGKPV
ncbi:CoA-transferase family III domain-containing protein [Xylariaceae sp. FL0804]|nr:CoA-transferase family III domain-containing protein [Xylariaceae sp. FL0804]